MIKLKLSKSPSPVGESTSYQAVQSSSAQVNGVRNMSVDKGRVSTAKNARCQRALCRRFTSKFDAISKALRGE